jgi:3'(2'), 5'-bisphosphate nucleotidase
VSHEKADSTFLCDLARKAGAAILNVARGGDLGVEYKADESPLTKADRASHDIIVAALRDKTPDIPIISEEDAQTAAVEERLKYKKFWIVDPLDGTKEFIQNRTDYTVNIALVEGNVPVLGVVYAPVRDWLYFGQTNPGGANEAFKQIGDEAPQPLPLPENKHDDIVAVRSRSHAVDSEEEVLAKFAPARTMSMGSSLKFCLLAEGLADVYFRAGPTWEWDTAAADAVLRAAGGITLTPDGRELLPYNKPSGKNDNGFFALARPELRARMDSPDTP